MAEKAVPIEDRAVQPRVWVLLGKGAGGNAQMLALAEALGWPYVAKQMHYNVLNILPNIALAKARVTLDRASRDTLRPPWPDVVIAASRRAAPVARWIKQRSGGRTRLVHLLHTQAPLHHFDLVVTLPQFRLPVRDNIRHNTLPLNTLNPAETAAAGQRWAPRFAHLARPWLAVLVGGNSSCYCLDRDTAARLGHEASAWARQTAGSLLVTTSRRTPRAATDALLAAIDCPAYRYRWRAGDTHNPYQGFLALADRFLVTADSASLPAEACATGRPVTLFDWRSKHAARFAMPALLAPSLAAHLRRGAIYWGLYKPRRDLAAFHRGLAERGLVGPDSPTAPPPSDLAHTVERVKALVQPQSPRRERRACG